MDDSSRAVALTEDADVDPDVSSDPVSRPMRKDAARNRQLLLDAARAVFGERGLDASLDDVAARAGVGVGTAYRHFANKYELARAILGEQIEQIIALAQSCSDDADPWCGITRFIESAAQAQTTDRGLREVLMGVQDPKQIEWVHERISAPMRELIERGKTQGVVRTDIEASDLGVMLLMLCTVADLTESANPQLWRRYLPMLLDGLRPGAALPQAPLDEREMHEALTTYKQRTQHAREFD